MHQTRYIASQGLMKVWAPNGNLYKKPRSDKPLKALWANGPANNDIVPGLIFEQKRLTTRAFLQAFPLRAFVKQAKYSQVWANSPTEDNAMPTTGFFAPFALLSNGSRLVIQEIPDSGNTTLVFTDGALSGFSTGLRVVGHTVFGYSPLTVNALPVFSNISNNSSPAGFPNQPNSSTIGLTAADGKYYDITKTFTRPIVQQGLGTIGTYTQTSTAKLEGTGTNGNDDEFADQRLIEPAWASLGALGYKPQLNAFLNQNFINKHTIGAMLEGSQSASRFDVSYIASITGAFDTNSLPYFPAGESLLSSASYSESRWSFVGSIAGTAGASRAGKRSGTPTFTASSNFAIDYTGSYNANIAQGRALAPCTFAGSVTELWSADKTCSRDSAGINSITFDQPNSSKIQHIATMYRQAIASETHYIYAKYEQSFSQETKHQWTANGTQETGTATFKFFGLPFTLASGNGNRNNGFFDFGLPPSNTTNLFYNNTQPNPTAFRTFTASGANATLVLTSSKETVKSTAITAYIADAATHTDIAMINDATKPNWLDSRLLEAVAFVPGNITVTCKTAISLAESIEEVTSELLSATETYVWTQTLPVNMSKPGALPSSYTLVDNAPLRATEIRSPVGQAVLLYLPKGTNELYRLVCNVASYSDDNTRLQLSLAVQNTQVITGSLQSTSSFGRLIGLTIQPRDIVPLLGTASPVTVLQASSLGNGVTNGFNINFADADFIAKTQLRMQLVRRDYLLVAIPDVAFSGQSADLLKVPIVGNEFKQAELFTVDVDPSGTYNEFCGFYYSEEDA